MNVNVFKNLSPSTFPHSLLFNKPSPSRLRFFVKNIMPQLQFNSIPTWPSFSTINNVLEILNRKLLETVGFKEKSCEIVSFVNVI